MAEGLTRGHKKRARTLEDLLEAATRVFARKEAILTTFMEVADEARVASGTVHNYFKSKDELIEAAAAKLIERINGPVWRDCERVADPAERLAIVIKSAFRLMADDPDWGAAMLRLVDATHRTTEKLTNLIPEILEEGRRTGRMTFRDAAAAMNVVAGTILAGMRSINAGAAPGLMGEHLVEHVMLALGLEAREALRIAQHSRSAGPPAETPAAPASMRRNNSVSPV
ncbi:MAG: helix-turn-helix domain-containing protein [Solimonas sp.]